MVNEAWLVGTNGTLGARVTVNGQQSTLEGYCAGTVDASWWRHLLIISSLSRYCERFRVHHWWKLWICFGKLRYPKRSSERKRTWLRYLFFYTGKFCTSGGGVCTAGAPPDHLNMYTEFPLPSLLFLTASFMCLGTLVSRWLVHGSGWRVQPTASISSSLAVTLIPAQHLFLLLNQTTAVNNVQEEENFLSLLCLKEKHQCNVLKRLSVSFFFTASNEYRLKKKKRKKEKKKK